MSQELKLNFKLVFQPLGADSLSIVSAFEI
jgi:hypothetical protein